MAISNLETIIDNIEQMIENVRPDPRGRINLPKDNLRQLIGELKNAIPEEIKRYNEKTRELEQTKFRELEKARHNAERILTEANEMRDRILSENDQVKLAEEKANQILIEAENKAKEILSRSQQQVMIIEERAYKDYDSTLDYMTNFVQTLGNDIAGAMNVQLGELRNKLTEIINKRQELQNTIARTKAADNSMQNAQQGINRQTWS